jgi:hypothetical protein
MLVLLLLFSKSCIVCHLARQVPSSTSHLIMPVSKPRRFLYEILRHFQIYHYKRRLILMAGISGFSANTQSRRRRPSEQSADYFIAKKQAAD